MELQNRLRLSDDSEECIDKNTFIDSKCTGMIILRYIFYGSTRENCYFILYPMSIDFIDSIHCAACCFRRKRPSVPPAARISLVKVHRRRVASRALRGKVRSRRVAFQRRVASRAPRGQVRSRRVAFRGRPSVPPAARISLVKVHRRRVASRALRGKVRSRRVAFQRRVASRAPRGQVRSRRVAFQRRVASRAPRGNVRQRTAGVARCGVSSNRQDESPSRGLSLNRSQRGNCSTEYNTPPGT